MNCLTFCDINDYLELLSQTDKVQSKQPEVTRSEFFLGSTTEFALWQMTFEYVGPTTALG